MGSYKGKSRRDGRAVVKRLENQRRRNEAKEQIREEQLQRVEIEDEVVLKRRIPIRSD